MIREYIIKISDEIMEEEIADRPQEVVRCKDCTLHEMRGEMLLCKAEDKPHTYDWFCAGGKAVNGEHG